MRKQNLKFGSVSLRVRLAQIRTQEVGCSSNEHESAILVNGTLIRRITVDSSLEATKTDAYFGARHIALLSEIIRSAPLGPQVPAG